MDSDTPIPSSGSSPSTPVWMKRVPMITGVLAGLGGFLTVRSNNMSNQANYSSTQAVLHQSRSSDAWNEYQADSVKKHGDQVALLIGVKDPNDAGKLNREIDTMGQREQILKPKAEKEAELSVQEDANSKQKLAIKDLLDYAGVATSLAIALASVAALTKARPAYHLSLLFALFAFAITAYAVAGPYIEHLVWHH